MITTISAVMASPITAQPNRPPDVKVTPVEVVKAVEKPPSRVRLTMAIAATESTPAVISPLYRAPMIDWLAPSRTA